MPITLDDLKIIPLTQEHDVSAFDCGWVQIEQNLRAEQQALQLREFYRNISESDKRFLKALGIKWSTN